MKVITAKIVHATHLELSQPIAVPPGAMIQISIPDEGEDDQTWRQCPDTIDFPRRQVMMGASLIAIT